MCLIKKRLVQSRNFAIYKKYDVLARCTNKPLPVDLKVNFVVSIASYPKRDPLLPAVFQALSNQTVSPQKWILVLSIEDYPNGLPKHLIKLEKRGLEILWVEDNPYAVKKLVPVMEKYPYLGIVTLDDDMIYHPSLLSGLISQANQQECIIGYVGKELVQKKGNLRMYYREPWLASKETNPEQVYLIGWGGIFYPPLSLDRRVVNLEAIQRIVPGRGSDIWFWAAAHANDTEQYCIGLPKAFNLAIPIPQNKKTKPKDLPGTKVLEQRFQTTIDFFEIRQRLLNILPEKIET